MDIESLAVAELLKEAKRGKQRSETMGPSGWCKPRMTTNKVFLKNTLLPGVKERHSNRRWENEQRSRRYNEGVSSHKRRVCYMDLEDFTERKKNAKSMETDQSDDPEDVEQQPLLIRDSNYEKRDKLEEESDNIVKNLQGDSSRLVSDNLHLKEEQDVLSPSSISDEKSEEVGHSISKKQKLDASLESPEEAKNHRHKKHKTKGGESKKHKKHRKDKEC